MIQPVKYISFGENKDLKELYKSVAANNNIVGQSMQNAPADEPKPVLEVQKSQNDIETKKPILNKEKAGKKLHNAKIAIMNFIKGFNNIKDTTTGVIKGAVEGVIAASVVGVFGKNLKDHDSKLFGTLGGVITDVAKEAYKIIKNIPSVITKRSPLNTITTIIKEPFKLAGKLKNCPGTIICATLVGLGFLAFRTIQGMIRANKANAKLDHALEEGHVPTK